MKIAARCDYTGPTGIVTFRQHSNSFERANLYLSHGQEAQACPSVCMLTHTIRMYGEFQIGEVPLLYFIVLGV